MKKKIYFFKFDVSDTEVFLPTIWFSFKNYYEQNGLHSDQWEWITPYIDYQDHTVEEMCEELLKHDADVYAFTSYMWSWNVIRPVAQRIRQEKPNAIIILGGPHQGTTYTDPIIWFKKYPYFDAACRPTEYGEFFMMDMLDAIIEDRLDWNSVRNSYHRKGFGPLADKRSFIFPKDMLLSNLDVALKFSEFAKEKDRVLLIPYETTRGCPYGCTYCEWGGGTNSKVVAKSIEDIESDLMLFPVIGIETLWLCDANFGILPRDKEIARLFAALAKTCLKRMYIGGLAKTSTDKRLAVLEPLLESGMIEGYPMAIQAISPTVGKIIDRVDISIEENVAMANYLIEKYNSQVKVELLLGLPGVSLEDFYNEYNIFYGKFATIRSPVFVLPDSPMADPAYIKKWDIKLTPIIGIESEVTGNGKYDTSVYSKVLVREPIYTPISSFSFTVEDWKEMMFIYDMDVIMYNRRMMKPFIDFMIEHRQKNAGDIFKNIYRAVVNVPEFFNLVDEYLNQIVNGELAHKDWKTVPSLNMHVVKAYTLLWIQNRDKIFYELEKLYSDDEQVIDCLQYVKNTTLREDITVTWKTKWDWKKWEELSILEKNSIELVTESKPINYHPLISRTDHSCQNGDKFVLDIYDAQIFGFKHRDLND